MKYYPEDGVYVHIDTGSEIEIGGGRLHSGAALILIHELYKNGELVEKEKYNSPVWQALMGIKND